MREAVHRNEGQDKVPGYQILSEDWRERPLVFGVHTKDEKRHILEKSRELLYTRYENVTVVPNMTKSQRKGEQQLRDEAARRNTQLTEEDRNKNLKWLVVGKRGEKGS